MSEKDKAALFVSKGLYSNSQVLGISFNTSIEFDEPSNYKTVQEPFKELTTSYYKFITHTYRKWITDRFMGFFFEFNKEVMIMEPKKAKRIAREHYISIAESMEGPKLDMLYMTKSAFGTDRVKNATIMELFSIRQGALSIRAIQEHPDGLDQFLMGNSEYFNDDLISKAPILEEILRFEVDFKILLTLNEDYRFEEIGIQSVKTVQNEPTLKTEMATKTPTKKSYSRTEMPSEEEIEQYLIKHVFSKK